MNLNITTIMQTYRQKRLLQAYAMGEQMDDVPSAEFGARPPP